MDIVLIQPRIPQNTGSIARTCAATGTPLHIVGPTPFEISDRTVRRAGLDYWPFVQLARHRDFARYVESAKPKTVWLIETGGTKTYWDVQFSPQDALVFGGENDGIPADIMTKYGPEQILSIPISCAGVRSLNLSNSVSIVLYEALRQMR